MLAPHSLVSFIRQHPIRFQIGFSQSHHKINPISHLFIPFLWNWVSAQTISVPNQKQLSTFNSTNRKSLKAREPDQLLLFSPASSCRKPKSILVFTPSSYINRTTHNGTTTKRLNTSPLTSPYFPSVPPPVCATSGCLSVT